MSGEPFNIPWQLNQTLSQTDKCQIFMKMTRAHPSLLLPPSVGWAQATGLTLLWDWGQAPFTVPFFLFRASYLRKGNYHSTCLEGLKLRTLTTQLGRGSQCRCLAITLTLYQGEKWH